MHVVDVVGWEFLIDDCAYIVEIKAAQDAWIQILVIVDLYFDLTLTRPRVVKGDNDINFTAVELAKNVFACFDGLFIYDQFRGDGETVQRNLEKLTLLHAVDEDQDLEWNQVEFEHADQQEELVILVDQYLPLVDVLVAHVLLLVAV